MPLDSRQNEFKTNLADVRTTLVRLAGVCSDLNEVVELLDLALGDDERPGNDAQLKILQAIILPPAQGKK